MHNFSDRVNAIMHETPENKMENNLCILKLSKTLAQEVWVNTKPRVSAIFTRNKCSIVEKKIQ